MGVGPPHADGRWAMGIGECLIGFGLGVDGHFRIIPSLKGRLFILNRRGKTKKIFVWYIADALFIERLT